MLTLIFPLIPWVYARKFETRAINQASIETNTSASTSFNGATNKVQVTNFDMPFGNMVYFMVKWAIASIPALIILFIIGLIFFGIFGALFF